MLQELGFTVRRAGDGLRGEAEITPFMHVPGTGHLRTSILATWADMIAGLLAAQSMRPRVPVTLSLDVHLYRPAPPAGRVVAGGRAVKRGRSVFAGSVAFRDSSGDEFGFADASFMAAPDVTLSLPGITSIDLPPHQVLLSVPLAERAGLEVTAPGVASLPRSEQGLNSSNTVNGGLLALCVEEAVLSLAPGATLSSLSLRYAGPVRVGPAVAVASLRDGLAQVTVRDSGRPSPGEPPRLAITAAARLFPPA